MWKFGHNNWIRYGWGEQLNSTRFPQEPLIIDCSDCVLSGLSPIAAAVEAVHTIAKSYPPPYSLMCSGGNDSQATIWAWHLSDVPFKIVSVRYVSDGIQFNGHDLDALAVFCEKYAFPVTYFDFDLISFLENDLHEVATRNDCNSPQICTHIKMSELVTDGTVIFSGNFLQDGGGSLGDPLLGLHRYSIKAETSTRKIIPFFLLHTPELAYSFMNTPQNTDNYGDTYLSCGFPVIPAAKKYNGFEEVKNYYDKYNARVSGLTRLKHAHRPSKRAFDLLFRYPYYRDYPGKNLGRPEFILKE